MSSLPRRTNQTDAEWQAITARTGKFNEENYGKKKPGNPAPPMTKGPVSPKAPPTMRPTGMDKGPVPPVQPPTRSPDRQQKMTPLMRAAGGAAKVRKGMMTSEGTITHAMNKVRGK
jgi:hypothetical protein